MKKFLLGVFIVSVVFAWSSFSYADTYEFGDSVNYWDSWGNGLPAGSPSGYPADDNNDVIGDPNFEGGTVTIEDGYLTSIEFKFEEWGTGSTWEALKPGDLFLDLGADQNWDYVVYMNQLIQPTYNVYEVDIALNSEDDYVLSGQDRTYPWTNYYIRDNHPIGIVEPNYDPVGGSVSFSGWGTTTVTFNFAGLTDKIFIGYNDFTIGWMPNCANDVVYETIDPIPEPSTVLLLGAGLLGLIGIGRKRMKK